MSNTLKLALAGIPLTALVLYLAFRKAHQPEATVPTDPRLYDVSKADPNFAFEQLVLLRKQRTKYYDEEIRPLQRELNDAYNNVQIVQYAIKTGKPELVDGMEELEAHRERHHRVGQKMKTKKQELDRIDRLITVQLGILQLSARGRELLGATRSVYSYE